MFKGTIGRTVAESTPWWPEARPGQEKRPNIVMVILDDTGWSDLGCFGSEIATPNIDALAGNGVRFNNFHVTPLCSPTRASLLTGRNHHSVGMRFLADTDTGFPNSRGAIRRDIPMLPQTLREQGYGTYLVGKWHLAPLHEITAAGPFHNWPLARGFDGYYGFMDGCTDQYEPELYRDNHPVTAPRTENYHLSEDLAAQAVGYVRNHIAYRRHDPFYLQLALGATHAPFQAPRTFIDKYIDIFAKGWDQTRKDRLARQIELGLAPAGTRLAERNAGVIPWEELSEEEHTVYSHLQAAFAGFLEHADTQIGRLIETLKKWGEYDNTIFVLLSDNGASREGGPFGDVDTNAPYSGIRRTAVEQLPLLDRLGGPKGGAHYPEGWAMAGNTPFRQYKQFVDLGGVRSPLIMSWPNGATNPGAVRSQFFHAVDMAPTLLSLAGIEPTPGMDGTDMAKALASDSTDLGRDTQHWETLGHRAVWNDGWKAVTAHIPSQSYEDDTWRLYDTRNDFSESTDLAQWHPERLQELQRLWWKEASTHDVFPLDDRTLYELITDRGPHGLYADTTMVLRPGQGHVPLASAVTGSNRTITATAFVNGFDASCSGTLLSSGSIQGGYVFYVLNGGLVFEHSLLEDRVRLSAASLPAGNVQLGFRILSRDGRSADVELLVNGIAVDQGSIPHVSAHLSFWGLDVGHAPGSTFTEAFRGPFPFTEGALDRIEIAVHPAYDDNQELADAMLASE